jgi:TolB protein
VGKKLLFFVGLLLLPLFGTESVVIEKYVENRPKIGITFDGPKPVLEMLKVDLKVLDHFNYTINMPGEVNTRFDFQFDPKTSTLKVTYIRNNQIQKTMVYRSNDPSFYPFLVHKAVYDINEYFYLPKADFLIRKVLYSIVKAPLKADIYLADYSLTYRKRIISGGLNIFPKWADDNQTTFFFTKMDYLPTLYKYNLTTGIREKVFTSQGMLVASDRKGDNLLLTMAPNGAPDIYLYNMKTRKLKRLTTNSASDVSGHFWGEDKIAFISDRYGPPLAFSKDLKSGVVQRILYQGKNQVGLDTYKEYVVVSSREGNNPYGGNTFNLFLMRVGTPELKRLTTKGYNGYPNFSVDGNSIMFIKRIGYRSQIGIIRLREGKVFYYPLSSKLQSFDW